MSRVSQARSDATVLSRLHSLHFYKRKKEWILERERSPSPDVTFDDTTTKEPTMSKLRPSTNWRNNDSSSSNSRMSTVMSNTADDETTTDDQTAAGAKTKDRGRSMKRRSDQTYYSDLNRTYSLDGATMDQASETWDSSVGSVVVHGVVSVARSRSTSMLDSGKYVLSASFLHRSLEELTDEATFARQAGLRPHSSQLELARDAPATYASIAAKMKKDVESLDLKPHVNHNPTSMAQSTSVSERLTLHASTGSRNENKCVSNNGNAVGKHHFIWNIRDRNANNEKPNVQGKHIRYSKEDLYMLNQNDETPKNSEYVCVNPDESKSELKRNDELFEFFAHIPGLDLNARQHMNYNAGNMDHVGNDWRMPNNVDELAWFCDEYGFASNHVNWENDKTFAVPSNVQSNGDHCQMLHVETGFSNNYENISAPPGFTHLHMYDRYVDDMSQNAEKMSNINVQDQNEANLYQELNTPYNSHEYSDEYFNPYDCFPTTVDRNHPEFYQTNVSEGYDNAYHDNNVIREDVLKKITVQYGGREISFIDEYTSRHTELLAPRIDAQNDRILMQNQNQHEGVVKKITVQYGGREISFVEEFTGRHIESVAPRINLQNDQNWIHNQNLPHMHQAFPNQAQHWPNQRFENGLGRGRGMRAWLNAPEPGWKEVYP